MSVKNTIRRLVKQLTASGQVTSSYEGTMMMVEMGDKGYDNKWPTRPYHQKNGSMRNKRRIRSKVNGFKETNVTIFTGVYPLAAPVIGENENGQVTVSASFVTTSAVEQPITSIIAFDPGTPDYPVQGQFSKDPLTGELRLDMVSVVPPGEGHPTIPVPKKDSWLYDALGGPDVPDDNRDFFNIWTGQGPATQPAGEAVIGEVGLVTQRSSLHELVSELIEVGPSPHFVNMWSTADADAAGIPQAELASMNEAMTEFAKSIDLKDPATAPGVVQRDLKPIVMFHTEPSHKEDFTKNTESTSLSEKVSALMHGVVLTQDERAERLQAEAGDIINQITAALNIYTAKTPADLPQPGDESVFYYVNSVELFFYWDGKDYMPISPASREGNRIVEVAFPQRQAAAKDTLDHPEQSDSRSWGRRVWDMIIGKDRG